MKLMSGVERAWPRCFPKRRMLCLQIVALAGFHLMAAPALAGTARISPQSPGAVLQGDGTVLSRHVVNLRNGKELRYNARAGFLPLRRDDAAGDGEVLARMFFVAYSVDTPSDAVRPVTFRWGGGPGGSSAMGGEGPRRVRDGVRRIYARHGGVSE